MRSGSGSGCTTIAAGYQRGERAVVNPGVVSGVSLVSSAARLLESPGGARRPGTCSARRPRECGWAWHEASPPPLIFFKMQ